VAPSAPAVSQPVSLAGEPAAPTVPAPIQPAAAPSPQPEPPVSPPAVESRPGYGPDAYSGAQGYRGSNFGSQEYAAHTYNSFPSAAAAALAQSAGNTTPEPVTPPPAKAPLPSWAPVSVHVPPRNPTAPKDPVKEPASTPAPVPPPPAAPVVAASSLTPFAVVPPPADTPGLVELPSMPSPAQNPGANILASPSGETLAAPAETPPAPDWSAEEQESPFLNMAGAGAALASAAAESDRAQYAINLKGRADGLVLEVGKGSWAEILGALADKLDTSGTFFRHGKVVVDLGPRPVLEEELRQLVQMLTRHEMRVTLLRTTSERSLQTALAMAISATLETAEGVPVVDAMPAESNLGSSYFVYRGYLRSGHKLFRKETILVIGDVNPGAEVISHGDVLVWGRLRGIVHAGAAGNHRAIVAALDLDPTQLRIASTLAVGADATVGVSGKWLWKRSKNKRPEIARLSNREIAVEEWDVTRPGGIVSLRRGGR
jgi:septum site-determining protein MinC